MLLTSGEFGCSREIAIIVAMLQIEDVFIVPRYCILPMKTLCTLEEIRKQQKLLPYEIKSIRLRIRIA